MTNLSETYLNRGDVIEFPSSRKDDNQSVRLNSVDFSDKPVSGMVCSISLGKCSCCGNPKATKVTVFIAEDNSTEEIDGSIQFRILARK